MGILTILFMPFRIIGHILYKLSGGTMGRSIAGLPLLHLITTGRKTGQQRTAELGYFEHDGGYVIIASNGGRDTHPGWYWNLQGNPKAKIELNGKTLDVTAEFTSGDLRAQLWKQLVGLSPQYGGYEKSTKREIPMVILHPESDSPA